jgi:bifunctional non-homologous end joining protein LigD
VALPRYRPQLATLVDVPPEGPEWVHELKLDGYRIGALISAPGKVCLQSRREIDWTGQFPAIVDALGALPLKDTMIDGEAAVLASDGRTSFQALQNSFERGRGAPRTDVTYFAFDLLFLNGRDLRALPLLERKALLEKLLPPSDQVLRYSPHFEGEGRAVFESAQKLGAEGIVSKRRDGRHVDGRSEQWLKIKSFQRQEFVIGGFTDPDGQRVGLGSLLLGVYDGDRLLYAGKVGTGKGWTGEFLTEARRGLEMIELAASPYAVQPPKDIARRAHWVRPVLVCEVTFLEWTDDGSIRHPSFIGFRKDKAAKEV